MKALDAGEVELVDAADARARVMARRRSFAASDRSEFFAEVLAEYEDAVVLYETRDRVPAASTLVQEAPETYGLRWLLLGSLSIKLAYAVRDDAACRGPVPDAGVARALAGWAPAARSPLRVSFRRICIGRMGT